MNKHFKQKKIKKNNIIYKGTVDITRSGMAFIIVDGRDTDIRVYPANLKTALAGDEVAVQIIRQPKRAGRPEGKVVKIIKRKNTSFTGTLEMNNGFAFLVTSNENLPDIYISKENFSGAKDGDKAVVEITDWGDEKHNPSGKVTSILNKDDPNDTAMKEILIENGFPLTFPDDEMKELESLQQEILLTEIKKRKDFRNTFTITIDPADAKDFDDAISLKRLPNGNFEIGVHIADVSYYVHPGTAIDKEAYERATSVYLADRVLPMLPEKISNELCSLRPDEDKLTFSTVWEITPKSEIKSRWIGKTIIHSDHRFTYEEVQGIIETKKGLHTNEVLVLNSISQQFRKRRFEKGAINFSSQEIRFKLDENAFPVGIEIKESKEAQQLIEELMLLANKTVAEYASGIKVNKKTIPFPYRVHDLPDDEKLKMFIAFASKFGYRFDISTPSGIASSFNEMLAKVIGEPEQIVLEQLGIRTMSKAIYTTHNIGHYGLGFENYCHFTSPIRRYPDIMVHRIIADCLNNRQKADKKLEKECQHCSEQERKAMEAERAANKYKQVEYMRQFMGEDFDAVISGVARFGFWAETLDAKCEGLVSVLSLADMDEFTYEESEYALKGIHTRKRFRMGDLVRVKLVAASLEKRQLDYELVSAEIKRNELPKAKKIKK